MSSDLSYIALDLRTLAVPLIELHEDPANARTGHDVDRIMASLTQYGQRKPIVVNRKQANKVEAGNGTLAAARRLGWSHIAAVFVDDDPNTATAYGIADNRTGDLSTWDVATLKDLADGLPEDLFTGFETAELDDLIRDIDLNNADGKEYGEDIADGIHVCKCPICGHEHAAKKD